MKPAEQKKVDIGNVICHVREESVVTETRVKIKLSSGNEEERVERRKPMDIYHEYPEFFNPT